jgi:hypothetical protein
VTAVCDSFILLQNIYFSVSGIWPPVSLLTVLQQRNNVASKTAAGVPSPLSFLRKVFERGEMDSDLLFATFTVSL